LGLSDLVTRARRRLVERLAGLEAQLDGGDETAWPGYVATLDLLIRMTAPMEPGGHGELLTTREMAERLRIQPKTLLRHKGKGAIRPAVQQGKLIRWRGTEVLR
jgi:hypothetical protein